MTKVRYATATRTTVIDGQLNTKKDIPFTFTEVGRTNCAVFYNIREEGDSPKDGQAILDLVKDELGIIYRGQTPYAPDEVSVFGTLYKHNCGKYRGLRYVDEGGVMNLFELKFRK